MDPSTEGQFSGEDDKRTIQVVVDEEARVFGLVLDPEWMTVVGESGLGDALVSAHRAAVTARDAAQLAGTDVAGLLRRLRALAPMSREEMEAHVGTAVPDASSHGDEPIPNHDLLDPDRRAAYTERVREIHQDPDEVVSGDGLVRLHGLSGRPTRLELVRGWGYQYDAQHQATQLFDLLDELAQRHDEQMARLEAEFPGLGERQQNLIDRGLKLVRSVPLQDEPDREGRQHG